MTNERRKELLKVVLMQVEKGNKVPSAILACSSDSAERQHITRALEACIPIIEDGRRAADKVTTYDRILSVNQLVRMTWVRRAIKKARWAISKEAELERLR